jgi:FkbM family methyltransferase
MRLRDRLAILVFGRLLPRRPYPVVAGPLRGRWFILGAAAGPAGGASILAGRCEPEQTAAVAASLRPGDVFFDVGANVGYYTLLAADRVGPAGRVVAFEPVIRNLSFLHRHLERNRVANVTVLPFACAAESGYAHFERGDTVATGHLAGGGRRAGTLVHTITVDAAAQLLGLVPTILKVDVEGAEEDVLRGAARTLRTARPRIFLSIHSGALRDRCLALVRAEGYEATPLGGTLERATEYLLAPAGQK